MSETEIDTQYTDEPICPFCGKPEDSFGYYLDGDTVEHECGYCEKKYIVKCTVTVEYCTSEPGEDLND